MDTVTYYSPQTGRISGAYSGMRIGAMDALYSNFSRVEGVYKQDVHYILDGNPTERPPQGTTLTGQTLTGHPNPCTLHIDGVAYPVDDDTVELDLTLPGTYRLRVEAFPYLDWTSEVTV